MLKIFTQYKGLSKSAYVLFFARLVTNMGSFIWPMMTLIMYIHIGYDYQEIANVFLIVSLAFLPATLIAGKIADKFDKKKIIIIFDIISVTFFFINAFIEPGTLMLICLVLAGLFATMEGPAYEALVIESTLPREREKVYSLTYLGHNVGFMVGVVLAGMLISDHLNLAFAIDGITTLMSTAMIIFFVKTINMDTVAKEEKNEYEDKADNKEKFSDVIKKRKSILIQIIVVFFIALVYDQWTFILPLKLESVFGEVNGTMYFGWVGALNGFVVIVFTPILLYLTRKIFPLFKMIIGGALISITFLLLISASNLWIYFIFIFFFTIGEIMNSIGSGPYYSRRIPSSHRGRINSMMGIFGMVGAMLGKKLIGYLMEAHSFDIAFATIAGFGIVAVLITLVNYGIDRRTFPKLYDKKLFELNEIKA